MNFKTIGLGLTATVAMATGIVLTEKPARALNLVTNGSFEIGPAPGSFSTLGAGDTSIAGWTVTQGSIDYVGTYWAASDGARSIDLNGEFAQGRIQQILNTVAGRTYRVTFDLAGNSDGGPAQKVISAFTGASSRQFVFNSTGSNANMGWITQSFLFTATAANTTLAFLGDPTILSDGRPTAFGPTLDNVSVTAIPTPALLPGLVGMGVAALRKRKGEGTEAEGKTVEA